MENAKDIITVIHNRGLEIFIEPGPPKMPRLNGNPDEMTPALLGAVKAWRLELIEELESPCP